MGCSSVVQHLPPPGETISTLTRTYTDQNPYVQIANVIKWVSDFVKFTEINVNLNIFFAVYFQVE